MNKVLENIKGKLIVSCQALEDEPLHSSFIMGRMAYAAFVGGAGGIRAKQIFELAKNSKIAEALEIQHTTNDLIEGILSNGLYQTIKEILKLEGVDAGYCRKPMKKIGEKQVEFAKELHKKFFKN